MTEKWKNRLRLQGEFGNGFAVGMVLAAVFSAAFLIFGIMPRLNVLADKWNQVSALGNENFDKMAATAEACYQREKERRSAATILYELEPGQGIEVLDGLLNLAPGRILGGRDSIGRTVVRWWIPAKVKPVVYDDARGRAYAWVDTKAGKVEGPFVPEVQR